MRTSRFRSKSKERLGSKERDSVHGLEKNSSIRTSSELSNELEGLMLMSNMMNRSRSNDDEDDDMDNYPVDLNNSSQIGVLNNEHPLPTFTQKIVQEKQNQMMIDDIGNFKLDDSSQSRKSTEKHNSVSLENSKKVEKEDIEEKELAEKEDEEDKEKHFNVKKEQNIVVGKKSVNKSKKNTMKDDDDEVKKEVEDEEDISNQYIISNERILVVCRIRPGLQDGHNHNHQNDIDDNDDDDDISSSLNSSSIILIDEKDTTTLTLMAEPTPIPFKFDYVAGEDSTQEELFARVGRPLAQAVISGYNATIFAYGQTGSGKTHTMFGGKMTVPNSPTLTAMDPSINRRSISRSDNAGGGGGGDMRGLIPRCLDFIFASLQRTKRNAAERRTSTLGKNSSSTTATLDRAGDFHCSCQFLEVYMEQVHDLLDPSCPVRKVRENLDQGVFVEGVVEEDILDAQAASRLLSIGEKHRHVAATAMNHVSSRSHAIFTLKVTRAVEHHDEGDSEGSTTKTLVSRFNLVDLAGSERQQDAQTEGSRLREASGINKSLSNLGLVIQALVDRAHGKRRHIHYRDSKVTFLLRDSLGGNSKTTMVCNVSSLSSNFGETLSSLRFAARAKEIPCHAEVNEEYSLADVKLMIRQLRALKAENAELKALLNKFRGQAPGTSISGSNGYANGTILGSSKVNPRNSKNISPRRSNMDRISPRRRRPPSTNFDRGGVSGIEDNRWLRNSTGFVEDFLGVRSSSARLSGSSTPPMPSDNSISLSSTLPQRRSGRRADLAMLSNELNTVTESEANGVDTGTDLRREGGNTREDNNLEGLVNQLEIEKTKLEDDLDEAEAASNVLQSECKDLAAQVVYLQVKLREAEDKSKITSFKAKIEFLQKEVNRYQKASKNKANASQEEKAHSELLAKRVNDLEYELAASQIETSRLRREMAERDKEISMIRSLGVTTTTGDKVTKMPRNQSPASESNFSMVSSLDENNPARNPIVRKQINTTNRSLTKVPSTASLVSSTYSSPTSSVTSPSHLNNRLSPTSSSNIASRLGLSTSYSTPTSSSTQPPAPPPPTTTTTTSDLTKESHELIQNRELADRLARLSAPMPMGTHKPKQSSSSSARDLRHTVDMTGERSNSMSTLGTRNKKKTNKSSGGGNSRRNSSSNNDYDNDDDGGGVQYHNGRSGSLSRDRSKHQSMSQISFGEVTVNNILNNSHIAFNKNDDDKRLTPKQLRSTSKTVKEEERKQNKILEKQKSEAKLLAKIKADKRIGNELLPYEIEELYNIGFFEKKNNSTNDDEEGKGDSGQGSLFEVIDIRKNAARGIRTKSLTNAGGEASLSQTLAEHRMNALHEYFESKWPQDLRNRIDPFHEFTQDRDFDQDSIGGSRIDLKKNIIPMLIKLETKLERGHALLEIISILHSAGSSETVAAVFADAAVAPGGTYWESVGVKIDKMVALRASDHCRIAVAVAKSTILRNKVNNNDNGNCDIEEIKQHLNQLQGQTTLLSAETINTRGSVFEIFGESSFDSRTSKQDELLLLAISRGNKEIEASSYLINENLRMVKLNESIATY